MVHVLIQLLMKEFTESLLSHQQKLVASTTSCHEILASIKSLKTVITTPLLLDPEVLSNYPPASNLPIPSRLVDKAIPSRLNRYINAQRLHDPFHSAHKAGHRTDDTTDNTISIYPSQGMMILSM